MDSVKFAVSNYTHVTLRRRYRKCTMLHFSDPAEISKLKKCYLNGKRYHLGEEIHPETNVYPDRCHTCLCTEDFDNTTTIRANKNCLQIDCEVAFIFEHELRRGCAPVFDIYSCCASYSKCRKFGWFQFSFFVSLFSYPFCTANENDEIESRSKEKLDGPICKFGNLTLQRGEKLKPQHTTYYYTSCACEIPPTLTCKRIKK